MLDKLNAEIRALVDNVYEGDMRALVFGEGAIGARLALVGEAPGEKEALAGRPFVGKAGKNLDAFLEAIGLDRREIYVTNTVKFRPTKLSAAGRSVNRPPTTEEITLFLPLLLRELALVAPDLIVTLGNVPLRALLGSAYTIGTAHGAIINAEAGKVFPLYHPASIIYNPKLRAVYEADMRALSNILI